MSLGFVMLVHESLDRAAQVARHLSESGCPLVIHVDRRVAAAPLARFKTALAGLPDIRFSKRLRCEWGMWSLVAATQIAARELLESFPEVRHVYLASGSCLPLRPIGELRAFLDARPTTDFIESATTRDVPWAVGGLHEERFSLRFPFSWKRQRRAFDAYVRLQRALGVRRRTPEGLVPHLGSQWWCLTRKTLTAILDDPKRRQYDRYFRRVWIPDESYFQTLVRLYSGNVESRSLTLCKFDFQGKPHLFYDDHLQLLRSTDSFFARKIWPNAERLYRTFLHPEVALARTGEPAPGKIDAVFNQALLRRTKGRTGLVMAGRYPFLASEARQTAEPYTVVHGIDPLVPGLGDWLARATTARVHGHLFAPDRAEFAEASDVFVGGLSAHAGLRDYDPKGFLTSLIWNTRGEHQLFLFGPRDGQDIRWTLAYDQNARIRVVTGSWAVELYRANLSFGEAREMAAELQKVEAEFVALLKRSDARADVRVWSLAEFVEAPMTVLRSVADAAGAKTSLRVVEAPDLADLTGLPEFLRALKNRGMHPHLAGELRLPSDDPAGPRPRRRPFAIK